MASTASNLSQRDVALGVWTIEDGGPAFDYPGPPKNTRLRYSKALRLFRNVCSDEEIVREVDGWSTQHIAKVRTWWDWYESQKTRLAEIKAAKNEDRQLGQLDRRERMLDHFDDVRELGVQLQRGLPFCGPESLHSLDLSTGKTTHRFGSWVIEWVTDSQGRILRKLGEQFGPLVEHVESSAQAGVAEAEQAVKALEEWRKLGGLCIERCHRLYMRIKEKAERQTGLNIVFTDSTQPVQPGLWRDFARTIYSVAIVHDSDLDYTVASKVGDLHLLHLLPTHDNLAWAPLERLQVIEAVHRELVNEFPQSPLAQRIRELVHEMAKVDQALLGAVNDFCGRTVLPGKCNRCPQ